MSKNPYRHTIAPIGDKEAAWDEGYAAGLAAGRGTADTTPPPEYEVLPGAFVYVGEDTYVEGVPFGSMQRHGQPYCASEPCWPGDEPVYRRIAPRASGDHPTEPTGDQT